jgi:four helix bundle protein
MLKHNFRQLRIWIDSVQLAKDIYQLTQQFPKEHKLGITNQLYRAAISIPLQILPKARRETLKKNFAIFYVLV